MVTFASLFRGKERLLQKRVESAVELELRAWYLEAINEQFAAVCRYLTTMVQRYILSIHTHTHTHTGEHLAAQPLDSVSVTDDQESPEVLRQR